MSTERSLTPVERLSRSRSVLAQRLQGGAPLMTGDANAVALRWLRRWWARHPWRTTFEVGEALAHEVAAPVAQRHPWWLLAGAFVAGMALFTLKPWRWTHARQWLAWL